MTRARSEPIACTLETEALAQRLAEFRAVLERAYLGRERLDPLSMRFRFRSEPGLRAELVSLAEREQRCCRFFRLRVTTAGDELWWEARVEELDARGALDELFALPETLGVEDRPARPDSCA